MILAFFGKELDRALESSFLGHRVQKAVVIEARIKKICFPSQLFRGVSIRIGHEKVVVQGRESTVHERVRGEAGFKSVNVAGQIPETLFDCIKARV
jgi:hypothetical protein